MASLCAFFLLFSLKGDNTFTYEGDRTREDIVSFARRLLGPPVGEVDSEKELREAIAANEITFAFVGNPKGELWVSGLVLGLIAPINYLRNSP